MEKNTFKKIWKIEFLRRKDSYESSFNLENYFIDYFSFDYKNMMSELWKFIYLSSSLYSVAYFYKLGDEYEEIKKMYIKNIKNETTKYFKNLCLSYKTLRWNNEQMGIQNYLIPFVSNDFLNLRNKVSIRDVKMLELLSEEVSLILFL